MEIAAIIFILIGLGIAYVTFRVLKKTVKIALRAFIVLILLTVTMAGGIVLWTSDGFSSPKSSTKTR